MVDAPGAVGSATANFSAPHTPLIVVLSERQVDVGDCRKMEKQFYALAHSFSCHSPS